MTRPPFFPFPEASAGQGAALFAGTDSNGVLRSNDNGKTWTEMNDGWGKPGVWSLTFQGTTLYVSDEQRSQAGEGPAECSSYFLTDP